MLIVDLSDFRLNIYDGSCDIYLFGEGKFVRSLDILSWMCVHGEELICKIVGKI